MLCSRWASAPPPHGHRACGLSRLRTTAPRVIGPAHHRVCGLSGVRGMLNQADHPRNCRWPAAPKPSSPAGMLRRSHGLCRVSGSAPFTRASGKSYLVRHRKIKNQRLAAGGYHLQTGQLYNEAAAFGPRPAAAA